MEKFRSRRVAVGLGATVLVLLLGLLWLYKAGYFGGSAFDLGRRLPSTARVAWMVNLRGQIDLKGWGTDLKAVAEKLPEDQRDLFPKGLTGHWGVSPGELLKHSNGQVAGALLPGGAMVALMGVRDKAGLEATLRAKLADEASAQEIGGLSFRRLPDGPLCALDGSWLYLAGTSEAAAALVASVAGEQTLVDLESFQEARAKVEEGGALFAVYWDLASSLSDLKTANLPHTDAQTFDGLACLRYGVLSVSFRQQQSNAFLKVVDDGSGLARALLSPGRVRAGSFDSYGSTVPAAHALDLEWSFKTALSLAMLSPTTRSQANMVTAGMLWIGSPFAALQGDLALASDWPAAAAPPLASTLTGQPLDKGAEAVAPSLSLSAPIKDMPLTRSLLGKFLSEQPDGTSAEQTAYATPLGTLLLEVGPPTRLSLSFGKAAFWRGQGTALSQSEVLRRALDWGGEGTVYADYLDLAPLLDGLSSAVGQDSSPRADFARELVTRLRAWPLQGSACLAVRADGLAWRSYGPGGFGMAALLGLVGVSAGSWSF